MNYMTKEYVKECDCKEVQGLRPKIVDYDFIINRKSFGCIESKPYRVCADFKEDLDFFVNSHREDYIYLPDGGQLDDEIVKICRENADIDILGYCFYYDKEEDEYQAYIDGIVITLQVEPNPLIAKIKLLKALLKE